MSERQTSEFSEAVLQGLKAFQRRTVEHAFSRLYETTDSTRRFLVADEAGLGKTLVAAGVIAKAIDHLSNENIGRIDVIYICSNQAIARQNVERIKQRLGIDAKALAERVTLLPYRLTSLNQRINLIALTPGTSFNSSSAEGVVEERIILFRMLTRIWGDLGHGGRLVFKGGLADVPRFRQYESWYRDREVDAGIRRRFRCAVGEVDSQLYHEFIQVRNSLVIGEDHQSLRRRRRFVGKLRGILANACLDSLEPDFVILDEFQRFRDLMDTRTESGELAQRLFEYEDSHTQVRTLLLSATPYKMYTLSHETEDDHYRDFLRTLSFLEGPGKSSERLEELLREFRMDMSRIALQGDIGDDVSGRLIAIQAQIQSTLQRVMSRTERRGSDVVGDPMLSVRDLKVDLRPDEVEAYLEAKEIAAAVNAPGVMEYWKSAPYLLSFMEQYKLPQRILDAGAGESKGTVAQLIRKGAHLQLERSRIDGRRKVDGGNGRMRAFLSDLNTSGLQKLLWLPPAMPSYKLGKDFSEALAATKRLVFSSWTMVPRAVAVMASYDAEHQYIRDTARAARYSAQLLSVTASSYSVFALLAPSSTLAEYGDPFRHSDGSTYELLRSIEERLRPRIEEITRGAPREGDPQEVWYAVAPLLLDGESSQSTGWLQGPSAAPHHGKLTEDTETDTWRSLVAHIRESLDNPSSLGRPPGDLLQVIAAIAAGSPANVTLRALSRITSFSTENDELKAAAMRGAWAFRSFFRAPAAEGLLRNLYEPGLLGFDRQFWRRILAYAIEGGLSDVLDEFFYVTQESRGTESSPESLVDVLSDVLGLIAGRLDVSEWKGNSSGVWREPFAMRQHLARRYVSDRFASAEQQTSLHLDTVRDAFNSPFWPFVLGTTSVGQEGLDFHQYCHAIVHWNLPPNPVDLEQREGRIHRYHGHAVRKNIAQAVGDRALGEVRSALRNNRFTNPWEVAYRFADEEFGDDGGLVPHWVFTEGESRIQRYAPVPPLSRDAERVDALRRSLTVYRMVFGQPRQDDFLDFILREIPAERQEELAAALTIDLSPPV